MSISLPHWFIHMLYKSLSTGLKVIGGDICIKEASYRSIGP
jgi:hypothetical protein